MCVGLIAVTECLQVELKIKASCLAYKGAEDCPPWQEGMAPKA